MPEHPELLYPSYGVTEDAYRAGVEQKTANYDKFQGVTYFSPGLTHVSIEADGEFDVMTIHTLRSDSGEAIDRLEIKKSI